ncbi:ribonuclease HepT family protein [Zobellia galactanivorans]|uniref:Apea-like HEPN domain-containing protein n=1 Tax=Zobellia galactanivorans (strain DSM 12802 / CCUG 47099 / CIP 106680 / NCIMB 13871 / Dsij) TaxID=63186 RepID=G0L9M5_ZOBGA|nr:hypothetical protein [Zobellia galactanivorans]CAZ94693.1 Conserved hypothetical protein [Zobellia galactanivorans]
MKNEPWKSGPKELLLHGLEHISLDTDFDNRMGMILVDNSVELMLKTYLGLPKRITGLNGVTRKIYDDAIKSFPSLLDTIEKFANKKLIGIQLGEIEWYHRIRNQLYHDGNGITVEKEKAIAYSSIAKILFENLFNEKILDVRNQYELDDFLMLWADFNKLIIQQGPKIYSCKSWTELFSLSQKEEEKLNGIVEFRNRFIHEPNNINPELLTTRIKELNEIIFTIQKK